MPRNSINRVVCKRDKFMLPMESDVPSILHLENRVSEKLITTCLLDGLQYRAPGVDTMAYFAEVDNVVNNSIFSAENENWELPENRDTLTTVTLSNDGTRTFARKIDMLFDVIFCRNNDNDLRRSESYKCMVTLYPKNTTTLSQIVKLLVVLGQTNEA